MKPFEYNLHFVLVKNLLINLRLNGQLVDILAIRYYI